MLFQKQCGHGILNCSWCHHEHTDSIFDVVAVSAPNASPAAARRNADAVMRSMATMGLPAERTALATMSSPTATSPEVHVYVR